MSGLSGKDGKNRVELLLCSKLATLSLPICCMHKGVIANLTLLSSMSMTLRVLPLLRAIRNRGHRSPNCRLAKPTRRSLVRLQPRPFPLRTTRWLISQATRPNLLGPCQDLEPGVQSRSLSSHPTRAPGLLLILLQTNTPQKRIYAH